jgi:hypothetical protein
MRYDNNDFRMVFNNNEIMYKKYSMKYKELISIIVHPNGNTKIFLIIIII